MTFASLLTVYYSIGLEPLKLVAGPAFNNNSGGGQFHSGVFKLPTGPLGIDVLHQGFQESPIDEGLIFGSIFIEDSNDGCISLGNWILFGLKHWGKKLYCGICTRAHVIRSIHVKKNLSLLVLMVLRSYDLLRTWLAPCFSYHTCQFLFVWNFLSDVDDVVSIVMIIDLA